MAFPPGESPESHDLDGLLREAERDEKCRQAAKEDPRLSHVERPWPGSATGGGERCAPQARGGRVVSRRSFFEVFVPFRTSLGRFRWRKGTYDAWIFNVWGISEIFERLGGVSEASAAH